MTQPELEKAASLGGKYVTHLESGRGPRPQDFTRSKIHAVFGTSDEDLAELGILERRGGKGSYYYVWPEGSADFSTKTPAEEREEDDAIRQIREAASGIVWNQDMIDTIVQQIRLLRQIQSSSRKG